MPARRRHLTRREIDVRLGYAGLGVGAVGFVLVLVASLVVIEVAPRVDLPEPFTARGQSVVRYPALEMASSVDLVGRRADSGPVERRQPVRTAPGTDTGGPTPDISDEPDTDHRGDDDGGGGSTPRDPGTPAVDGPVSQTVDPVVDGILGAVDSTTGGASTPVTAPAGGVVDDVTDLGDGLLPRP